MKKTENDTDLSGKMEVEKIGIRVAFGPHLPTVLPALLSSLVLTLFLEELPF